MVSHTVLLVVGGALLTGLLGALVFGSTATAEDRRMQEERKLLRALEAQRRIRDAQLARDARRRGIRRPQPVAPPAAVEPSPVADTHVIVADEETGALQRAADRERKRDQKQQAAALKAQREADKRAERRAAQERTAAAKVEREKMRTLEREQKQQAKAALKAEQATAKSRRAANVQPLPPPAPVLKNAEPRDTDDAKEEKPLSELPLFSWASRIDDDDQPTRLNT